MSRRRQSDPSVEHEPHLRASPVAGADGLADEPALRGTGPAALDNRAPGQPPGLDDVEHTVWDEPTLVSQTGGAEPPEGQLTYRRWLEEGIARTGWGWTWWVTLGTALLAGPFGIIGAFSSAAVGSDVTLGGFLAVTVLAPVTEEIVKVAGALWLVEKRPYWMKSMLQLLICAGAGGLAFAAIENLLYTLVYVPQGGEAFRQWRWTVCVALHVNCSLIAGWGLVRIWDKAIRTRTRPDLGLGMPFFALAMITHGLYNAGVTIAEVFGWLTFE